MSSTVDDGPAGTPPRPPGDGQPPSGEQDRQEGTTRLVVLTLPEPGARPRPPVATTSLVEVSWAWTDDDRP